MVTKKFKIYFDPTDGDRSDITVDERSPADVEGALENFPGDLEIEFEFGDKVATLEKNYSSGYIVVEITSVLTESQFRRALGRVLLNLSLSREQVE